MTQSLHSMDANAIAPDADLVGAAINRLYHPREYDTHRRRPQPDLIVRLPALEPGRSFTVSLCIRTNSIRSLIPKSMNA